MNYDGHSTVLFTCEDRCLLLRTCMPVITYDVSRNPAFESSVKTNSNSCPRPTAQYKPTVPNSN